ncbi:hypothetical protein D3C81_800290 [compost metagenome]
MNGDRVPAAIRARRSGFVGFNEVTRPKHYTSGKVECIDAIESAIIGLEANEAFLTGQVLKYMWRWKRKNGAQDLQKARWYLDRLIGEAHDHSSD